MSHLGGRDAAICFDQLPHAWAELLEPQITKAFAHFLSAGGNAQRAARILAFLKATVGPALLPALQQMSVKDIRSAASQAEATSGDRRRIDLIAWLERRDGQRLGAVIEAKVGHHITEGQLRSYEGPARQDPYRLEPKHTAFLVVAPALTRPLARQLRGHPNWLFLPWRVLIMRLDSEMTAAGCDDDDFVRFRRTLWNHAA
ncbi:MAG: PD-(D/E)XK nuclease family protein [Acidobacteria bacterium]|nr:PD-(D/E)XK nuclease family protein [Acidobacteriota bacterium]